MTICCESCARVHIAGFGEEPCKTTAEICMTLKHE